MLHSFLLVLLLSFSGGLFHDDLDEKIERISRLIAADETSSGLLLERADLHRRHRSWTLADNDLLSAEKRGAGQSDLHWAYAKLLYDQAQWESALTHLDALLLRAPKASDAYLLRAQLHAQRGATRQSADDYGASIETAKSPNVDVYLARARTLATGGTKHLDEAIRGLDQGLYLLGPVPALLLEVIQFETKAGRLQSALARIDAALKSSSRREAWFARRGDLLICMGKATQARQAYEHALVEIRGLNSRQRATRSMRELKQRMESQLLSLGQAAARLFHV